MRAANALLCTVGTSLAGHVEALPEVAPAWRSGDAEAVARLLIDLTPGDRRVGAEIQSVGSLVGRGHLAADALVVLFPSATSPGRFVARVLHAYFRRRGHRVEVHEVDGLQDDHPKLFKGKGLRNLARLLCRVVRERGAEHCAVNATGGYKAQVAIAAILGQALGVPVYYQHERFDEIVAFPPMPVSLDQNLWMRWSGLFGALDRLELVRWSDVEADWEPRLEPLVERVVLEAVEYLDLSPVGQVFHESFRGRLRAELDRLLPPPAPPARKRPPRLTHHGWGSAREPILGFLGRLVADCPYVTGVRDTYWNPDLSTPTLFRLKGDGIEGVYSDGTWTVKLGVDTTAATPGQREACVADLNGRVEGWG